MSAYGEICDLCGEAAGDERDEKNRRHWVHRYATLADYGPLAA
jgi:hypothetical protein